MYLSVDEKDTELVCWQCFYVPVIYLIYIICLNYGQSDDKTKQNTVSFIMFISCHLAVSGPEEKTDLLGLVEKEMLDTPRGNFSCC